MTTKLKKRQYTKRADIWAPDGSKKKNGTAPLPVGKHNCVFCRRTATCRLIRFISGTSTVAMNVSLCGAHLKSIVNKRAI